VGKAFLISILDLVGLNPESRLIKSSDGLIKDALDKIKQDLKRSLGQTSMQEIKNKIKKGS
jgi:hypothetical protein